jgi:hypothetical protein
VKIKGISPVADHWRTKAEELERSLALKGLQAEAMREAIRQAVEDLKKSDNMDEDAKPMKLIIADLEQALNERKGT